MYSRTVGRCNVIPLHDVSLDFHTVHKQRIYILFYSFKEPESRNSEALIFAACLLVYIDNTDAPNVTSSLKNGYIIGAGNPFVHATAYRGWLAQDFS